MKKDGHFTAKFKVKRHLFECCTAYIWAQKAGTLDGTFIDNQQRALSVFLAKEEPTRREKGKGKDTVGEGKGSGPAWGKKREQQPEAGPSWIWAMPPLPNKKANTVEQPLGAAGTLTCNSPSHVSVDGSCLTHFIHAYGYLPIHPKKGEKQGPAMELGVVKISNRVFWVSG